MVIKTKRGAFQKGVLLEASGTHNLTIRGEGASLKMWRADVKRSGMWTVKAFHRRGEAVNAAAGAGMFDAMRGNGCGGRGWCDPAARLSPSPAVGGLKTDDPSRWYPPSLHPHPEWAAAGGTRPRMFLLATMTATCQTGPSRTAGKTDDDERARAAQPGVLQQTPHQSVDYFGQQMLVVEAENFTVDTGWESRAWGDGNHVQGRGC